MARASIAYLRKLRLAVAQRGRNDDVRASQDAEAVAGQWLRHLEGFGVRIDGLHLHTLKRRVAPTDSRGTPRAPLRYGVCTPPSAAMLW